MNRFGKLGVATTEFIWALSLGQTIGNAIAGDIAPQTTDPLTAPSNSAGPDYPPGSVQVAGLDGPAAFALAAQQSPQIQAALTPVSQQSGGFWSDLENVGADLLGDVESLGSWLVSPFSSSADTPQSVNGPTGETVVVTGQRASLWSDLGNLGSDIVSGFDDIFSRIGQSEIDQADANLAAAGGINNWLSQPSGLMTDEYSHGYVYAKTGIPTYEGPPQVITNGGLISRGIAVAGAIAPFAGPAFEGLGAAAGVPELVAPTLETAPLTQLELNVQNGAAFQSRVADFGADTLDDFAEEVSIRPNTPDGTADFRVRLDGVGTDTETGNIDLLEAKSSETAPLTQNQEPGFLLIENYGGTVVGENGGSFYPAGTEIPPTVVRVIRPSNLPPGY